MNSNEFENFVFFEPGILIDRDLELKLTDKVPVNIERNYSPQYKFTLFKTGTKEVMGMIGLRPILTSSLERYGGNINYHVDETYRGHNYAARSCRLLFPLARKHGIKSLLITCDPKNIASVKTCELLNGTLLDISLVEIEPQQFRDTCRYEIPII